jgi:hypothetical protein
MAMDIADALQATLDLAKFANESFRDDAETFRRNAEAIGIVEDMAARVFWFDSDDRA